MNQLPFSPVPVSFLSSLSLLSPSRCSPRVRCCVQCCSVTFLSSFSLLHVHLVYSAVCSAVLLLSCLSSRFFMSTSCAVLFCYSPVFLLSSSCSPRAQRCSCFFPVFPRSSFHITAHPVCSAAPVSFLSSLALLSTSLPTPCAVLLLSLSCLPSLFFPHHCPPRVQRCSCFFPVFPRSSFHITAHPVCSAAPSGEQVLKIASSPSACRFPSGAAPLLPSPSSSLCACLRVPPACSVVPSDDACHLPQRGLSLPISLPSRPRSIFTR